MFSLAERVPRVGERICHPAGFAFDVLEADPRADQEAARQPHRITPGTRSSVTEYGRLAATRVCGAGAVGGRRVRLAPVGNRCRPWRSLSDRTAAGARAPPAGGLVHGPSLVDPRQPLAVACCRRGLVVRLRSLSLQHLLDRRSHADRSLALRLDGSAGGDRALGGFRALPGAGGIRGAACPRCRSRVARSPSPSPGPLRSGCAATS